MGDETGQPIPTRTYTTIDGRAVIEQPQGSVAFTAAQILAVISELHACYDYCAAWKGPDETTS